AAASGEPGAQTQAVVVRATSGGLSQLEGGGDLEGGGLSGEGQEQGEGGEQCCFHGGTPGGLRDRHDGDTALNPRTLARAQPFSGGRTAAAPPRRSTPAPPSRTRPGAAGASPP